MLDTTLCEVSDPYIYRPLKKTKRLHISPYSPCRLLNPIRETPTLSLPRPKTNLYHRRALVATRCTSHGFILNAAIKPSILYDSLSHFPLPLPATHAPGMVVGMAYPLVRSRGASRVRRRPVGRRVLFSHTTSTNTGEAVDAVAPV